MKVERVFVNLSPVTVELTTEELEALKGERWAISAAANGSAATTYPTTWYLLESIIQNTSY